jgi:hypothetical protein
MNNNLDTLVFQNHDTYVYYPKPLLNSEHKIILPPVNNNDKDIVSYSSFTTELYTNGVMSGVIKFNRFERDDTNLTIPSPQINNFDVITDTFLVTLTTSKGILNFNFSAELVKGTRLYVIGQTFSTYATYKSNDYNKYLYVKIEINADQDDYRVVTVSY